MEDFVRCEAQGSVSMALLLVSGSCILWYPRAGGPEYQESVRAQEAVRRWVALPPSSGSSVPTGGA